MCTAYTMGKGCVRENVTNSIIKKDATNDRLRNYITKTEKHEIKKKNFEVNKKNAELFNTLLPFLKIQKK